MLTFVGLDGEGKVEDVFRIGEVGLHGARQSQFRDVCGARASVACSVGRSLLAQGCGGPRARPYLSGLVAGQP